MNMKRTLAMVVVLLFTGLPLALAGEPVAPLLPLSKDGEKMMRASGKTLRDIQNSAPSRKAVSLPVYPGAYYAGNATSGGKLVSVELLAKEGPAKVVEWYEKHLGPGWARLADKYLVKQLKQVAVFAETTNPSPKPIEIMNLRTVQVMRVEKPEDTGFASMFFDVSGVRTRIVLGVTPMF